MGKGNSKYFPILALIIDIILLFNAFLTADYFVFDGKFPHPVFYYQLFAGWVILWVIIALSIKLYDLPRIFYIDRIVLKNLYAITAFFVISSSVIYFVTDYKFSRLFFVLAISLFSVMLIIWHSMLTVLFKAYRRNGNNFRIVAILGFNKQMEQIMNNVMLNPENGYKISGVFSDEQLPKDLNVYYRGKENELLNFLKNNTVDELFISLPAHKSDIINNYMNYADNHMIRVHILPNFSNYMFQNFSMKYIQNTPILELRKEPLESLSNRMMKRAFDLTFSILVLVFIGSWLFPILAILIKLTSKGPVFFSQIRSGRDDKPFKCLKFRSMIVNSEADSLQTTKNDTRTTSIGKFIRKTSLDEMPQFFNVLLNKMSVVGPRPHMLQHTEEYNKQVDKYMVRQFAKPGISGWAQIKGYRGEIKEIQDIKNRAEADIWYIENWNILLDIKIIILTVWQVVFTKEKNAF